MNVWNDLNKVGRSHALRNLNACSNASSASRRNVPRSECNNDGLSRNNGHNRRHARSNSDRNRARSNSSVRSLNSNNGHSPSSSRIIIPAALLNPMKGTGKFTGILNKQKTRSA